MAKNKFDTSKIAKERKQHRAAKRAAYFESRKMVRITKIGEKKLMKLSNPGYVPGPNRREKGEEEYPLMLHDGGKRFHGLTILDVADTKRDNKKGVMPWGVFVSPATVTFLTPAGKKWHMRIEEFGFIINAKY